MATIDKFLENENNNNDQTQEVEITSKPNNIFINADFDEGIVEIGYVFLATNETKYCKNINGRINLLQGRMYYIPINNTTVDSDNYNIKVHSDIADRADVRFIKDGLHVLYRSDTMLY